MSAKHDEPNLDPMVIDLISEEDDPVLPEGWADDDDLFAPESWSGEAPAADAQAGDPDELEGEETEETDPEAPTAEQEEAADDTDPAEEEAPTTEQTTEEQKPKKIAVRYTFDHKPVEEEIDLESDLPVIVQKSKALDRVQARLKEQAQIINQLTTVAKEKGFESIEDMLKADAEARIAELVEQGTAEQIARDYVERRFAKPAEIPEVDIPEPAVQPTPKERDYAAELQELHAKYPETVGMQIPDEVIQAAAKGDTLRQAYADYKVKLVEQKAAKERAEKAALAKKNAIYKQNEAAAARAPVRGVSGGGKTDTEPDSAFLTGFNSDMDW